MERPPPVNPRFKELQRDENEHGTAPPPPAYVEAPAQPHSVTTQPPYYSHYTHPYQQQQYQGRQLHHQQYEYQTFQSQPQAPQQSIYHQPPPPPNAHVHYQRPQQQQQQRTYLIARPVTPQLYNPHTNTVNIRPAPHLPTAYAAAPMPKNQMILKHEFCHCGEDCGFCLYATCCGPCAYGNVYEKLHPGGCLCGCLMCGTLTLFQMHGLIGCGTRQSVFRKNGLNAGNPLADFLLHTFCWPCALTQEMRAMDYISGARRRLYYGVDPNASR